MSKRRRAVVFALCLLGAAVLVLLERTGAVPTWRPLPPDLEKYHGKAFTIVNIVDGDTLDIDIPDGKHEHTRIRLLGIDTPETRGRKGAPAYFGTEAAAYATKLAMGKRAEVYLDEQGPTRGKYGRLLAYVKLTDDRFLNEVLLTEGYAYADLRFRHPLYNKYQQLEAVARKQSKGLWENVSREQLPQWLREKKPTLMLDR